MTMSQSCLLDLPMRDGNLLKRRLAGFAEDLLDLPMRDGNFGLTVDEVAEEVLLDLPMRDGNAICTPGQERPSSF